MTWQQTIYAYPILLATAISLALVAYTFQYGRQHGLKPTLKTFIAMNVAIAIWTGFSAIKLLSTDPAVQFHSYRFLYFGSSSVGPLLLLFVLAYTDRITELRSTLILAVFAVPIVFWALLFTNPYDLVIVETRIIDVDGLVVMRTQTGPAHILLSFMYAFLIALVTLAILLFESFKRGWSYLPQASLLGVAIVTPIAVSALTSANIPPFTVDSVNFVPPSTVVSTLALSVATYRYRLLDLRPIAYRTVVDSSPDAMLILDDEGRIVHLNKAATALFHADMPLRETPISEPLNDIKLKTDSDQTIQYQSTDGPIVIEVRSRPLKRRDKAVGWVVVCRDITERKRREAELEAFTAVVSHDLQAPLRTTERNLDLLETTAGPSLETDMQALLDRSKQNTKRTQTMLSDLLAYSRIEANHHDFEVVDMNQIVSEVVESLAYDIERHDATIESVELPQVRGINHLLYRLVQNLVANSLQHGNSTSQPDDSSITISLDAARKGTFWEFTVADDGAGMNGAELDYVFELFSQGSNADYDAGTGMGLAICHKIVDSHGGTIDIQSSPGEGTRVTFTLPATTAELS